MLGPRAILRPEVDEDLHIIVDYLAERSPQAAIRFARAVPKTVEDILRFPGAGSPKNFVETELAGIRSWPIRGFKKYLILYRQLAEGILILAVLHGARDIAPTLRRRT